MAIPRPLASTGALAVAIVLASASAALARVPPMATDPREGVWIGGGEVFIQQTRDRWSVFPAGANVNKIAVDDTIVWVATDDGVIRFDSGTRRATRLGMDEGLPSQVVTAVAFDDQFVWFATNKGLVRYRKLDRSLRVFTEADGLPHISVNDALTVGRQVWFATRAGIAVYTPETDGLRAFTEADGLASGYVAELFQLGDDLWCRTDAGLSRFRVKSRSFTNFSMDEIGGQQLRTFIIDSGVVWIATENGLFSFDPAGDAIVPFRQQAALESKSIMGVEVDADYVYITTEKEVVRYFKNTKAIQRFTVADGLVRREGAIGTVMAGGMYTVVFADGAEVYDIGRELWNERSLQPTQTNTEGLSYRIFGKFDGKRPYDLGSGTLDKEHWAKAEGGFAVGRRFQNDRLLNSTLRLDYGEVEMSGIRDLQFKAEYLGNQNDILREVNVEDKLKYRTLEEGLERPLLLQGAHIRTASPGKEPKATVTVDAGVRRGAVVRDFITGPRQNTYQLSKRYILAGTERVYVDGELLTSGVDYTIVYPAGQLTFLNPERVDDLSVVWVEYEYDLVNKKGLGVLSLLDMLPVDGEVGGWVRSGEPRPIGEESALYAAIDGGAPRYIDRGWKRSIYADYRQGSRTIQVKLSDMDTEVNAESIYNFDLPAAREPVGDGGNMVIDLGKSTSFEIKAHAGSFYIEISIDDNSDAAKQSLKVFALQVLNRGTNAGEHLADQSREALLAARAAASPIGGLEVGARAVQLQQLGNGLGGLPGRSLLTGVADARYQREVGQGGLITAYGEMAGSHGQNPGDTDGWAGTGFLRFSHERAEGTFSARHDSSGYTPMGSNATRFGRLSDEYRLNTTVYPTRWLPTTVFFDRQMSSMAGPGGVAPGQGLVQHALARLQLNRDDAPATSLQLGHTLLDDASSNTGRFQVVGQTDYDLARILSFTHIKRFTVRGYYSWSEANTETLGLYDHADRVRMLRIESRLSPTTTEQLYGIFRQRIVDRQKTDDGAFDRSIMHWELTSGFQSGIIPGLVPKGNYNAIYDDDRITAADPTRAVKGSWAAALGIYPGQWWSLLAPVAVEPVLSVTDDEQSMGGYRTTYNRNYRIENRAVYAGGGRFDAEMYQRYEMLTTASDHHTSATKAELRNRLVYRPTFASPITLRLNYMKQRALNDLLTYPDAGLGPWGVQASYEGVLEWLMRWNPKITTKARGTYLLSRTTDVPYTAPAAGQTSGNAGALRSSGVIPGSGFAPAPGFGTMPLANYGMTAADWSLPPTSFAAPTTGGVAEPVTVARSYRQHKVGGELELRFFPMADASRVYLVQRDGVFRFLPDGPGASDSVQFYVAGGAIIRLGDQLYLDTEVIYRQTACVDASNCTSSQRIEPRLYFTFNL